MEHPFDFEIVKHMTDFSESDEYNDTENNVHNDTENNVHNTSTAKITAIRGSGKSFMRRGTCDNNDIRSYTVPYDDEPVPPPLQIF